MQPDHTMRRPISAVMVDRLTDTLFDLAGDQEVRVIEALAAVMARRWREDLERPHRGLSEPAASFASTPPDDKAATRRAICQRVARRALRGSLVDPTRGATAVHRIDVSPAWSRDRLPIGMFGPFLFYRLTPRQLQACDWLGAFGPSEATLPDLMDSFIIW